MGGFGCRCLSRCRFRDDDGLVGGVGCLLGGFDLGRGKLGELLGLFGRVAGVDPGLRVRADGGGVGRLVGKDTPGAAESFEDLASSVFESGIRREVPGERCREPGGWAVGHALVGEYL